MKNFHSPHVQFIGFGVNAHSALLHLSALIQHGEECGAFILKKHRSKMCAHPHRHHPTRPEASRAEQNRAEQNRAEHSRAQQSRAQHSTAQQSRADFSLWMCYSFPGSSYIVTAAVTCRAAARVLVGCSVRVPVSPRSPLAARSPGLLPTPRSMPAPRAPGRRPQDLWPQELAESAAPSTFEFTRFHFIPQFFFAMRVSVRCG